MPLNTGETKRPVPLQVQFTVSANHNVSKEKRHKAMIHAKAASDLSKESSAAEAGNWNKKAVSKLGGKTKGPTPDQEHTKHLRV